MPRKRTPKTNDSGVGADANPVWYSLGLEAAKLRGLGFLIEHQRDPEYSELDAEEVNRGLAAIINEISTKIAEHALQLDEEASRRQGRRKS
ncbi:hypothetical protein WDW37_11885 [Bdellovibrionota bacterium FG-1]